MPPCSSEGFYSFLRGLVSRTNCERAAAVVIISRSYDFESEHHKRCRIFKEGLREYCSVPYKQNYFLSDPEAMAEAKEVEGSCWGCHYYKEIMKDCPGYEKLKFENENEGVLSQAEVDKLPYREMRCHVYISLAKRTTRMARKEGKENNCKECNDYNKKVAEWGCVDLLKKKKGAGTKKENA